MTQNRTSQIPQRIKRKKRKYAQPTPELSTTVGNIARVFGSNDKKSDSRTKKKDPSEIKISKPFERVYTNTKKFFKYIDNIVADLMQEAHSKLSRGYEWIVIANRVEVVDDQYLNTDSLVRLRIQELFSEMQRSADFRIGWGEIGEKDNRQTVLMLYYTQGKFPLEIVSATIGG